MGFPGDYLLIAVRFAREVGSRLFGRIGLRSSPRAIAFSRREQKSASIWR